MRNINRISEFCNILKYYWEKYVPDWRFGQLIENIFIDLKSSNIDPFYLEENDMIDYIIKYLTSFDCAINYITSDN